MESHGAHKKTLQVYWVFIGVGIGIVMGASTKEWIPSMISGIAMGIGMAVMATKKGVDL